MFKHEGVIASGEPVELRLKPLDDGLHAPASDRERRGQLKELRVAIRRALIRNEILTQLNMELEHDLVRERERLAQLEAQLAVAQQAVKKTPASRTQSPSS